MFVQIRVFGITIRGQQMIEDIILEWSFKDQTGVNAVVTQTQAATILTHLEQI